jgi:hypothetical protein
MSQTKLRTLNERLHAASHALGVAVEGRMRPGDRVHVRWGENEVRAEVVRTYGRMVWVRSTHGKEYRVDATRIVEFDFL